MAVECPNESAGWNSASEALAEIRACGDGLQATLAGVFDQLDQMAGRVAARTNWPTSAAKQEPSEPSRTGWRQWPAS